MGIRFYCPVCDKKINVKEHQAGLRGICPACGTGVAIPLKSEPRRKGNERRAHQPQSLDDALGAAGERTISAVLPRVGRLLGVSANPPPDPLTEFPQYQWYVVPQGSTEPFGPADGTLIHQWIQEGRVGARSMVWRQDWKEWRKAGTIWSQLVLAEAEVAPSPKLQRLASVAPQFGSPQVPTTHSSASPSAAADSPTSLLPTPANPAAVLQPLFSPAPGTLPGSTAVSRSPTGAGPSNSRGAGPPPAHGFDNPEGELYYPQRTNGLYLTMVVLLVVAVIALGFVTLRILDQVNHKKTPATPVPEGGSSAPTSYRCLETRTT